MKVEMFDTIEELPSTGKRKRGPGPRSIIEDFVNSDKQAMLICCDTIEEAHSTLVASRNIIAKDSLELSVWRTSTKVCFEKIGGHVDGNKDL